MARAKRLVLIGLDAATLTFVQRFMKKGIMPHLKRLVKNGIVTEAIPSSPVDTPTNWATIATGANVNIHGVTSFTAHIAGENFLIGERRRARTKNSSFSKAEFFWNTAEEHGKRSLIINYPVAWPSTIKDGIVIGGMCPGADIWRIDRSRAYAVNEAKEIPLNLESVRPEIGIDTLSIRTCEEWEGVKSNLPPLKTEIELVTEKNLLPLNIISEGGEEYDTVVFKTWRGDTELTFKLHEGEWSDWIYWPFRGDVGVFRLKLVRLFGNGQEIEIYRTAIFRTRGWSYPQELAQEIIENVGPYIEGLESPYISPDVERYPYGPVNVAIPIILELAEMQASWFSSTIQFLLNSYGWDMLFMHYHLIDTLGHAFLAYLDPKFPGYSLQTAEAVWRVYREAYHIIDNMIGQIVDNCTDESTLIGVISDHGALPCWKTVDVVSVLIEAGLLHYEWDTKKDADLIDLSRSKAIPYIDPQYVWINLKDREFNGIVPKNQYENVILATIKALRSIKDPDTGETVMALVSRREDLGLTGLAEDRIGDIVFFLKPGYSTWDGTINSLRFDLPRKRRNPVIRSSGAVLGHHAPYLPSEKYDLFSNRAMLILAGPGVRTGYNRVQPINLKDVAPTLAYLLELPSPANSEGHIVEDILEK